MKRTKRDDLQISITHLLVSVIPRTIVRFVWLDWLKSSATCLIPIDSCHSSFRVAGSIGMLAALFGPIEEQARSVHTQSEQWLRRLLRKLPTDVKVQIHGAFMVDISNPDPVYAKCKVCSIKIDPVTKQCKKARESRCPSNPWGDDPNLQHPPGRFLRRECRHPGRLRHPLSASRALLTLQHCRLSWQNQAWLRAPVIVRRARRRQQDPATSAGTERRFSGIWSGLGGLCFARTHDSTKSRRSERTDLD